MSEITDQVVKGSRKMAKKASRHSQKLAKQVSSNTQEFLQGTVKSSNKLAKNFSKGSKNVYKQFSKGNISEGIKGTGNLISDSFSQIVNNDYLNVILKVLIALYTAFSIPHISKGFAYFFDNLVVKILFALLIVYVSSKDPSLAILIALSYILTLQQANKYRLVEKSQQVEPIFNNEYFNYDNNSSEELSESSQPNQNNDIQNDLNQNDLNEKSSSLNQNFERVDFNQESNDNQYQTRPDCHLSSPQVSEESNSETSPEISSETQIPNQVDTAQTQQDQTITDPNQSTQETQQETPQEAGEPVPVESSPEQLYQTYNEEESNKNITTPKSESIDFASRQFDNCMLVDDGEPLENVTPIQGYDKDAPAPYSSGDLPFSSL